MLIHTEQRKGARLSNRVAGGFNPPAPTTPCLKPQLDSENRGSNINPITWEIACWIILSSTVGIPSGRLLPSGFGISTLRTGEGTYVPSKRFERIWGHNSRKVSGNCSTVTPSIPGAPLLARTCFQARRIFSAERIRVSPPSATAGDAWTLVTRYGPCRDLL